MFFCHFSEEKQTLGLGLACCMKTPFKIWSTLNPIALRRAKIVYSFGLSECKRVIGKNYYPRSKFFPLRVDSLIKRRQKEMTGFLQPELYPFNHAFTVWSESMKFIQTMTLAPEF